jgi:hypothetical protein
MKALQGSRELKTENEFEIEDKIIVIPKKKAVPLRWIVIG